MSDPYCARCSSRPALYRCWYKEELTNLCRNCHEQLREEHAATTDPEDNSYD